MTPNTYFVVVMLGFPLVILALAMLAGGLYRGSYERLLDWKLTRSPEREAELEGDTHQMLAALNRYRRSRGAPECSLEELTEHAWATLDEQDER